MALETHESLSNLLKMMVSCFRGELEMEYLHIWLRKLRVRPSIQSTGLFLSRVSVEAFTTSCSHVFFCFSTSLNSPVSSFTLQVSAPSWRSWWWRDSCSRSPCLKLSSCTDTCCTNWHPCPHVAPPVGRTRNRTSHLRERPPTKRYWGIH